jgi:LAO/AO transport system kinase
MTVVQRVLGGETAAAARLMRDLDDRHGAAVETMRALWPHTGRAYLIGITGSPGSGKSTLCDALIAGYRARGLRVGVVAVDPSSPFSGGAILGDRIRMQRHAVDDGVFIRSLATRGHLGGLSRSTGDVVAVLDAMGFERVVIETVGVGQDEVEVASLAHVSVVVTVPGLGDDVQALKAGTLEIADILVVNKADREGADRTVHDLESMLSLRAQVAPPPVLKTIATTGGGVAELVEAIEARRGPALGADGEARVRRRSRAQLVEILRDRLALEAERRMPAGGLDALAADIATRRLDPYSAADVAIRALLPDGGTTP